MSFRATVVGTLLLCCPLTAGAQAAPFDRGVACANAAQPEVHLAPWAKVIADPSNRLTAADMLRLPWKGSGPSGDIPDSVLHEVSYWFLVPLANPGPAPLQRLLVLDPGWLDEAQITLVRPDGTMQEMTGGASLPFSHRAAPDRRTNFELSLPPGRSRLLLRARSREPWWGADKSAPQLVRMTLWDKSAFYAAENGQSAYFSAVYAALGALLVFNLFLFFSVRDRIYGAYVAYLGCFMIMHASYNGQMFEFVWPNHPDWNKWAISIFTYLFILAGLSFATVFLDTRNRLPAGYRWTKRLMTAVMVSAFAVAPGGYGLHMASGILWVGAYSGFVIFLGVWSLVKGNRAARYFLPATVAGLVGSALTGATVSGIIPFSIWGYRAIDIGMLVDASLLSLALADRVRISRHEAEQAKERLVDATRLYAQHLERDVADRTKRLRNANAIKDKFMSIIAHDLRGPIGSMALYFEMVDTVEKLTDDGLKKVRATLESTRHLLEELLTWSTLQREHVHWRPVPFDISEVAREMQRLFAPHAQARNIALEIDMDEAWVLADQSMTRAVLRNLTDNALKFTESGGRVRASLSREAGYCRITVEDTGIGMDAELRDALFSVDAKALGQTSRTAAATGESGVGLGLILCKEFVERNGGAIGADSEPGKGARLWFTLPSAPAMAAAA